MKNAVCLAVLLGSVAACTTPPEPPTRAAPDHTDEASLACLSEAIYFEAGNAAPAGRRAVGHVILNRVEDPRFPNTICGVVQEGEASGKCQFSYRCQLDTSNIRWPQIMVKAKETTKNLLFADAPDPTDGALYFHAKWMPPGWFNTLKRVGEFGGNIFYRG